MQLPLEITFRNMDRSEAVEERINEEVAKLERHFDRISSCRVSVVAPARSQANAKIFECHIELRVPNAHTIVVDHAGKNSTEHADVYIAVRDSFRAAVRQLDDYARKMRGEVKHHEHA